MTTRAKPAPARRPPTSSQLRRLWEIGTVLPTYAEAKTAKELLEAGGWNRHIRTMYRDLDTLKSLGLARKLKPRRADGLGQKTARWCAEPKVSLTRTALSTDQAIALWMTERLATLLLPPLIIESLKPEFEKARRHLDLRKNTEKQTRWVDKVEALPDGYARKPKDVNKEVLGGLQEALLDGLQVKARYRSLANGKSKLRTLEPRALVQVGPTLYLIATRADKPEPAPYAVQRFISAKPTATPNTLNSFRLDRFIAGGGLHFGASGKQIEFKARVSRGLRRTLEEAPLSDDMELKRASAGDLVTATVYQSWPFVSWILSRGPEIEVLGPEALREDIRRRLQEAAHAYG